MLKLSLWLVILLVASCHARFVPSQNRNPTPSPEDALDTESASVEPTHKSPSASDFDVAGSAQGNPFAFGSAFGSDRDAMGDAVRDAFRMLEMFRNIRARLHPSYPPSYPPRIDQRPHFFNPFRTTDDDSADDSMMPSIFIRRPSFSVLGNQSPFDSFMQGWPISRPVIPPMDFDSGEPPKGYTKRNETRFMVNGREYCKTVFEKRQEGENFMSTSTRITVLPCNQTSPETDERESGTNNQPDKKEQDRRSAKPQGERELEDKPHNSDGEPNPSETAPEVNQKPQESVQPISTESPGVKPEETSAKPAENANEIPDKTVESPDSSQPTITVNDK